MRLHTIIIQQKFNFSKRFQKVNDFMQKSDETGFFSNTLTSGRTLSQLRGCLNAHFKG